MPFSVNENAHVQACGSKQQIVRQYPKPVADIQGRKQRPNAGDDVKIGDCDIEDPGQPNCPRHQLTGVPCHFLSFAEVCRFSCRVREHHAAVAVLGGQVNSIRFATVYGRDCSHSLEELTSLAVAFGALFVAKIGGPDRHVIAVRKEMLSYT